MRPDRCGTCKFFEPEASQCRAGLPSIAFGSPVGIWPAVTARQWCGNWAKIEVNYEAMTAETNDDGLPVFDV